MASLRSSRAVAVAFVTFATFTDIVAYSIAVPVLPDLSRRLGASLSFQCRPRAAQRYQPSPRRMPAVLPPIEYEPAAEVRRVDAYGDIGTHAEAGT